VGILEMAILSNLGQVSYLLEDHGRSREEMGALRRALHASWSRHAQEGGARGDPAVAEGDVADMLELHRRVFFENARALEAMTPGLAPAA
jgi:hypothetical protein